MTPPFHGGETGSIPVRGTIFIGHFQNSFSKNTMLKSVLAFFLCLIVGGTLLAQKSISPKKGSKHSKVHHLGKHHANKSKSTSKNLAPAFKDSFSYALGVNYARYILAQGIVVRPQDIAKGMSDFLGKRKLALDSTQIQQVIDRVARASMAKIVAQEKDKFAEFLANNKRNPKVHEIAQGLQYEILKDSTGAKPTDSSRVTVNYVGRLLSGEIFDQTTNGNPISFGLNQVIRGWREALIHMPKGSVWRVYIASDLAYGDRGAGSIPGGAGLIFDIQLLDIKP